MKISMKIAAVAVVFIIIPIIIATFFRHSSTSRSNYESAKDNLESITVSESNILDSAFSSLIGAVKAFAGESSVVGFITKSESDKFTSPEMLSEYVTVKSLCDSEAKGHGVYDIVMFNESGNMVFSYSGKISPASDMLYSERDTYKNGVSHLYMYDGIPVFCVEKNVYQTDRSVIGRVCFIYDFDFVASAAESIDAGDFSELIILDSSEQIIEYPFKAVKSLEWNAEYKYFSEEINALMENDSEEITVTDFIDYKFENKDKSAYASKVKSTGWAVIGLVNLYDYNKNYFHGFDFVWIIAGVEIIAAVIVIYHMISPVSTIIDYLEKRKKGDNSQTLNYEKNDEIGSICYLLNTYLDDLSANEEKYRTITEMSDDIVFDINLEKETVTVSGNFNKNFSFRPKNDSLKESFLYKCHVFKDDKTKYLSDLNSIITTNATSWEGDYRIKTLYGEFSWMRIKAKKLLNRKNIPTRIIGIMKDIDRQKESELNLIQKASFDALTELYNRETFIKMLKSETDKRIIKSSLTAVMFIDLDDFKFFNDEYGHKCGDEVLRFTADTINEACFKRGFGGRYGGDEFILCITDLKLIKDAGEIAEGIINTLVSGFDSNTKDLHLSIHCSIGIAFLGENGRYTPEELITAADAAMYKIKKHGKSGFAYASDDEKEDRNIEAETSVIESNLNNI